MVLIRERGPLFVPDFFVEDVTTRPVYDVYDTNCVEIGGKEKVPPDLKDIQKFNAFADGSMRLYRIGVMRKYGIPLYFATISAVVLSRGKDKVLRSTTHFKRVSLIIFPKYLFFQIIPDEQAKKDLIEILENLKKILRHKKQSFILEEELPKKGGFEFLAENSYLWIFCDISFKGITSPRFGEETSAEANVLIKPEDLFNPNRIKNVARARSRFIMNLLEFASVGNFILEQYKQGKTPRVLVDEVIPRLLRIKKALKLDTPDGQYIYQKCVSSMVGFIKNPRVIPKEKEEFLRLLELDQFEFKVYKSKSDLNDLEAYEESVLEKTTSEETDENYFIFLKFRKIPEYESLLHGLVKIHLKPGIEDIDFKEVASAVYYERFPFPSNRNRFFNEPFPIEEAEKVAQSLLVSEEEARGFMFSILKLYF